MKIFYEKDTNSNLIKDKKLRYSVMEVKDMPMH